MNNTIFSIETKNLLIQKISLDFKDEIFQEFTSEITTYMYPKPAEKITETINFIENAIKENLAGTNLQTVILNKNNKEFLGCAGLHMIKTSTPELGIWIKKSAQGNGFGKETILALKEWADNNLNYEYLIYPVDSRNIASKKIPESIGAIISKESDQINLSGKKLNVIEYRIYKEKPNHLNNN